MARAARNGGSPLLGVALIALVFVCYVPSIQGEFLWDDDSNVSENPTLYWFVSDTVTHPLELTVVDERATEPVVEVTLTPPVERGIHALSLRERGVRLEPGVTYQWFVALVVDPEQRSSDIIAGGELQRVSASATLRARLRQASAESTPAVLAEEGIWYDALGVVSAQIDRHPQSAALREHRAAMLEQVGLDEVARADRVP